MALTTKQLERKRKENKDTKPETTTKAEPETIDIKARQSEVEKEAEEAKATVREVGRKERRGRELPYKGRRTKGLKGVVSDIEKSRKEAQAKGKVVIKAIDKIVAEHEKQIKGIAKYKSADGYDLVAMIQDGYTDKQLTEFGFAKDAISTAQSRANEVAKAAKYKGEDGYDIVAMVNTGYTQKELESLFGKDTAQDAITRADVISRATKYKTGDGYDVAQMVRDNFPSKDMDILFSSETISYANEIVKADKYKTETGYDLLAMYADNYSQGKLKDMGFDAEAVREAYKYHLALESLEPYKTEAGTYDLVAIGKAVDKGHLQPELIDLVLGGSPEPLYLSVAQVHQLRTMNYELAKVNAEAWGISIEQLDKILEAPTDVAAKVYAYLQETSPEAIELTHPSQLPSFQQTPDWRELISALEDVEPYKVEGNEYDVAKAYQAMIDGKLTKASFIVAFGDNTYKDTKAFYDSSVEIKPGTFVVKTEWEGLTPEQQKEVIATGQYTLTPSTELPKDGKSMFAYLQSIGDIHPLAEYKGYDEESGEVSYIAPKTELPMDMIMEHWEELNDNQKRIQINGALNKNVWRKYKDFEDLTKDEKNQVLRYYVQSYLPFQTNDKEFFENLWQEQKAQLKEIGLGMIPVYGTIRNWDNMSPTWRGISIAMDVAVIVPFIAAGARAIKGAVAPLRAQASALAKAELTASKGMARTLSETYATASKVAGVSVNNRALARSYTSMIKAQGNYLKQLARVTEITAKGGRVSSKIKLALSKSELNLRSKASIFVDKLNVANSSIKGTKNIPVRFDSAEVKALMRGLPNEMVQNSKAAIRALEIRPQNIKTLTRAVASAETKLKAAQTKHPTDPSKWVDLMYDLTKAEGKLAQARTGSVTEIYQKLLKAREAGQTAKAAKLEKQLAQAIKSMEVEWGRLGFSTGGRVAVDVGTKPFWPTTGISPAAIQAATASRGLSGAQAGVAAIIVKAGIGEWEKTTGVTTPDIVEAAKKIAKTMPKTKGTTTPEVVAMTNKMVEEAIKNSLKGQTESEIKAQVTSEVKPMLDYLVDTKAITQQQFKALLSTTVKVATKLARNIKTGKKAKPVPPILPKVKTNKEGRPIYPPGTVVFRMGKTKRGAEYKAMLPPYNQAKLVSSKLPPVGMKRTSGTPSETLTVIGDKKLPFENISADLGVVDVFVDTKKKKIRFKGGGLQTDVGRRIPGPTRGVSLANTEMRVTREGQIFKTQLRGQKGYSLSRFNPKRGKGRRGRLVRG